MWLKTLALLLFVFLTMNKLALAQEKASKPDSTALYQNIESYSDRSRFTKFMYRLFFKPVSPDPFRKKTRKVQIQQPYSSFEGKVIRHIKIVTLDPFGNSIGDTITTSVNFLSRAGNRFHIKTRSVTIRNLLLVRQNQLFDSLLVKESERLVRSSGYITDVSFFIQATAEGADSVDIFIRELDKWSTIPGASATASRVSISLRENNFLGLGHEFQNGIMWNHSTGDYAYKTKYFIPNIRNTYVNTTWQYGSDEYGNFIKSVDVDRPFFSPYAKWAAGANFLQHLRNDSVWSGNFMQFKYNRQDFWAGGAIRLFKGNTEFFRTTNFVSAARFIRVRFLEKPDEAVDTLQFYTDENFYLTSMGISTRQYVQEQYIFKFGITEDVPVGSVVSLTAGFQKKNHYGRYYLGARFSSGSFYNWGYLSTSIEFGTFFHPAQAEQGVFTAGINYFTGLISAGRWKFRQFVKPQLTIGFDRGDYDYLTLNNENGLYGFYSRELTGSSRLLFTSQTQAYSPWNFIGFRFGPYFTFSLGMLGNEADGFRSSKVYSQIGFGVLIKNDNLVMNAFQLSVAFYPIIPGNGKNIFKMNPFETTDFGFSDFEIGKPETVVFR